MYEYTVGFIFTIIALCVGYNLGKNQEVIPTEMKKQLKEMYRKIVPDNDVGPVVRPTPQQNFYRDNPKIAEEHEIMNKEFENLIQK